MKDTTETVELERSRGFDSTTQAETSAMPDLINTIHPVDLPPAPEPVAFEPLWMDGDVLVVLVRGMPSVAQIHEFRKSSGVPVRFVRGDGHTPVVV